MNKYIAIGLISIWGFAAVHAKDIPLTSEKLIELKKTIKLFTKPTITVVEGIERDSYYFLQLDIKQKRGMKRINAFLDKATGSVYTGSRYDANGVKSSFPKTAKSIEIIKKGISFSYGSGKKNLYVVTDPECPYCVRFEKQALGKLDDYTVHVILYPLSFHKKAPAMVEWIMQGVGDAEKHHRMEELMVKASKEYMAFMGKKGTRFNYTDTIKIKIDNAIKAAKSLGATGTPTVYDDNFNKINWKSLVVSKKPVLKNLQKK